MNELGKTLVILGLLIAAAGAFIWTGVGRNWIGRLPGDLHFAKGNFSFSFPIVTCVLAGLIISLLLWLFRR